MLQRFGAIALVALLFMGAFHRGSGRRKFIEGSASALPVKDASISLGTSFRV